jgi:hypothetical protein
MGAGLDGGPLRVDGDIWVSRVGQRRGVRFISPTLQREEIEAWVSAHDAQLLQVFEELDRSGRRPDRPLLQEAARRIEAGVSSGLVMLAPVLDAIEAMAEALGRRRSRPRNTGASCPRLPPATPMAPPTRCAITSLRWSAGPVAGGARRASRG